MLRTRNWSVPAEHELPGMEMRQLTISFSNKRAIPTACNQLKENETFVRAR
jgi:hypothetical protein